MNASYANIGKKSLITGQKLYSNADLYVIKKACS